MSWDLLFQNQSAGSADTGGTPYERAVFPDVSLTADVNLGVTDNALTNPTAAKVGNPDAPLFQAKTLLIKDVVLIADESRWINNQPTYQIIFQENLGAVSAFAYGSFTPQRLSTLAPYSGIASDLTDQRYLEFAAVGSGIGVTGKIRRLQWLVQPDYQAPASAMRRTDGSNTSSISFANQAVDSYIVGNAKYAAFNHQAANETNDLHTFELLAEQGGVLPTMRVIGVVVYFENAGANLEILPGRTFVDKTFVETTLGATFPIPAFGSSLGGVVAFQKTPLGYTLPLQDATPIMMQGIGLSGTNLVDVVTGQGGSFLPGMGFIAPQGSSTYVGAVRSVSTDTLTVSPTLPFGVSTIIYSSWLSGPTYLISPTLMQEKVQIGASNMLGLTSPILDPAGRFAVWGANVGPTFFAGPVPGFVFNGASGFLQIEGYFQAADVEIFGPDYFGATQIFHATISVNGLAMWGENQLLVGPARRTLMTNGGNGWNSIVIGCGASMGAAVQISKINLYTRRGPIGASFGVLGLMRVNQAEVTRPAQNATLIAFGMQRRVFADQLMLTGAWSRTISGAAAGGVGYNGTSTNAALDFQYFGKDFAVVGSTFTAGSTLTVDGVGVPLTPNQVISVGALGFHTLRLTAGVSSQIQAVDFFRPYDEIENTQKVYGAPEPVVTKTAAFTSWSWNTPGTYYFTVPKNGTGRLSHCLVRGGGGGGAGGGNAGFNYPGGGGGAAGACDEMLMAFLVGDRLTITVGAFGLGAASAAGGNGGDTTIVDGGGGVRLKFAGGPGGQYSGSLSGSGPAGGIATGTGPKYASGGAGGAGGSGGGGATAGAPGGNIGAGYGVFNPGAGGSTDGTGRAGGGGGGASAYGNGGKGGDHSSANHTFGGPCAGGGGSGANSTIQSGANGGAGFLEIIMMLGEYEA